MPKPRMLKDTEASWFDGAHKPLELRLERSDFFQPLPPSPKGFF